MPGMDKKGDKKDDDSLIANEDREGGGDFKEKKRYVGEYRGLAEYIGFTDYQRKWVARIISWSIVVGFPFLVLSVILFLSSFL